MVRKSKSCKDISLQSQTNAELVNAEIACLKAQNIELAKSLVDARASITQLTEETNRLQKELLAKSILNRKLKNFVNEIHVSAASSLKHTREILKVTNIVQQINNVNTNYSSPQYARSPNTSNRMHAVKPMVGGHVILRPTINLRRINEISLEELQRLTNSQAELNEESTRDYTNENEEDENEEANNIDEMNSLSEEQRNHLTTLQEESLNEGSPNRSQHPILSGVFQDVRVYLSPMPDAAQYHSSQNVNVKPRSKKARQSNNNLLSVPTSPLSQPCSSNSLNGSLVEDLNNSKLEVSFLSSTKIIPSSTVIGSELEPQPSTSYATGYAQNLNLSSTSQVSSDDEETIERLCNDEGVNTNKRDCAFKSKQISAPKFEPPSSLSSSSDAEIEAVVKEQTLKSLGLIPTSAKHSMSPTNSASPATTVLKRRRTEVSAVPDSTEKTPQNREGTAYVTRRKSKKKLVEPIRFTRSKQKKEKLSLRASGNIKKLSPQDTKTRKSKSGVFNESLIKSIKKSPEKRKSLRKIKAERKSNSSSFERTVADLEQVAGASSSADTSRKYSPKKLRVKRGPAQGTFKERSLNIKLRR